MGLVVVGGGRFAAGSNGLVIAARSTLTFGLLLPVHVCAPTQAANSRVVGYRPYEVMLYFSGYRVD